MKIKYYFIDKYTVEFERIQSELVTITLKNTLDWNKW